MFSKIPFKECSQTYIPILRISRTTHKFQLVALVYFLSFGSLFAETAVENLGSPSHRTAVQCFDDTANCTDEQLCKLAIIKNGKSISWATAERFKPIVAEAKGRGLDCEPDCTFDISTCSDQFICKQAVAFQDGEVIWSIHASSQKYVNESKKRALNCKNRVFEAAKSKGMTVVGNEPEAKEQSPSEIAVVQTADSSAVIGFDWSTYDSSNFMSSMASKQLSAPLKFPERDDARLYLDFTGDGIADYFVATKQYSAIWEVDRNPKTARKGFLRFYRGLGNGQFALDKTLIQNDVGCIHPRKAIVNDFNSDSKPDIFVACHGWDSDPFPGENSKLILSQGDGSYLAQDVFSAAGYVHSAASADFDGDGIGDLLVNDSKVSNPYQLWLGNGDGTFKKKKFHLKGVNSQTYFVTEVFDFNLDGRFDLFVAGQESGKHVAFVYLNKAKKGFTAGRRLEIPSVSGAGVVLDVIGLETDGKAFLYILRTGDQTTEFYRGIYVQRCSVESVKCVVIYRNSKRSFFPWLVKLGKAGKQTFGSDDSWEKPVDSQEME